MYFLLGFRLLGPRTGDNVMEENFPLQHRGTSLRNRKKAASEKSRRNNLPFKQLLMLMSRQEYDQVSERMLHE